MARKKKKKETQKAERTYKLTDKGREAIAVEVTPTTLPKPSFKEEQMIPIGELKATAKLFPAPLMDPTQTQYSNFYKQYRVAHERLLKLAKL